MVVCIKICRGRGITSLEKKYIPRKIISMSAYMESPYNMVSLVPCPSICNGFMKRKTDYGTDI